MITIKIRWSGSVGGSAQSLQRALFALGLTPVLVSLPRDIGTCTLEVGSAAFSSSFCPRRLSATAQTTSDLHERRGIRAF